MTVRLEIEVDFRPDGRIDRTPEQLRRAEGRAHENAVEAARKAIKGEGFVVERAAHGHRNLEPARTASQVPA